MEWAKRTLKELILKQGFIMTHWDPHLTLLEALFQINFLIFDTTESPLQRNIVGPILWRSPLPLVHWRYTLTRAWQGPHPLLTQGWGFVCVFPETSQMLIWIPAQNVCKGCDEPILKERNTSLRKSQRYVTMGLYINCYSTNIVSYGILSGFSQPRFGSLYATFPLVEPIIHPCSLQEDW